MYRGPFAPCNNLDSKRPIFTPQTPAYTDGQHDFKVSTNSSRTGDLPSQLPSKSLSELGDSSSLFSIKTDSDFEPTSTPHLASNSPIPFVLGASKQHSRSLGKGQHKNKMVNERSPAKAPLRPVVPNDQPPRAAESEASSKPAQSTVPQFGQPTMPHSPLRRPAQKESSVFIQPKARPEHHRDSNRPCILFCLLSYEMILTLYSICKL